MEGKDYSLLSVVEDHSPAPTPTPPDLTDETEEDSFKVGFGMRSDMFALFNRTHR